MRILLLISHGLYLRNYGTLVEALAQRGHEVLVAATSARPSDDALLAGMEEHIPGVRLLAPPARDGWWWASLGPLRAVRDYLRYCGAEYRDAPKLKARASNRIPALARRIFERSGLAASARVRRALSRALAAAESAAPTDPAVKAWISGLQADALLVTPLVDFDYVQLDFLKAGQAAGVPSGLLVASWDNLTTKGLIQIVPDLVTVWNSAQAQEAQTMHRVPADRIAVTGAQLYDQWFDMRPARDRRRFCETVGGLDPARPIILYLCSSPFIAPDEPASFAAWLSALRSAAEPLLRNANVLVRPHPVNPASWHDSIPDTEAGRVAVWPATGQSPIGRAQQQDYFDSLFHAAAVVGLNTSGFLEAAIVGRRSLVLGSPQTAATLTGTLHFRYLIEDGFLLYAEDQREHLAQLEDVLSGATEPDAAVGAFVARFLRPNGIKRPALPYLVNAVEDLPNRRADSIPPSGLSRWLALAIAAPIGLLVRGPYKKRLARHGRQ